MADLKHGEHVGELPAYAAAFKEVYRFILEARGGDDVTATRLFRKYLAGEMPEEFLVSRAAVRARSKATVSAIGRQGCKCQHSPHDA